ncbi:MAG: alpha/beta hydrolase [Burkholderiaceae bacterium]
MQLVRRLVIGTALAYAALLIFLYFGQEKLIFLPTKLPSSHVFNKPDVVEVQVPVQGATLSALHYKQPKARGLVFYLHGNAGNLETWLTSTEFYQRNGFDLFMIDYRGYGRSTGHIESESQLHADVRAAYDLIAPQYQGRPIAVLGRSLGTALAAKLAVDVQPALTVLVSPYSSMRDMARQQYPFVPLALLRYPLDTGEYLSRMRTRALLLHGEADSLIPIRHSERLLARANSGLAQLVRVPQAGHNDIHQFEAYIEALSAALKRL